MAKGSGSTRAIYSSNGKLGILSADAGEMPDRVVDRAFIFASYDDYKESRKAGFDVSDNTFHFITKDGELHSVSGNDELPKIKKNDIIFAEWQNAVEQITWYNGSKEDYRQKIYKQTHYIVK